MIIPRIGLGKKSHLPCFKILDFSFGPIAITKVFYSSRKLSLQDLGQHAMVKTGESTLKLTRRKAGLMASEWGIWNRYCTPKSGVLGKTILEVGSGCGETTALLFEKGAKKVVCVEPNDEEVKYLLANIEENKWNAEVIPTKFSPSIISNEKFDLVRMDCEGCESELLSLNQFPDLIVEIHSKELRKKFLERGLKVTKELGRNTCIMSNVQ